MVYAGGTGRIEVQGTCPQHRACSMHWKGYQGILQSVDDRFGGEGLIFPKDGLITDSNRV